MKKNNIIYIVIIAIILLVLIAPNILLLQNYGTGLSANTTAVYYTHKRDYDPWKNAVYLSPTNPMVEPFTNEKYIVSWQSGADSQLITFKATTLFTIHEVGLCGWCSDMVIDHVGTYQVLIYYTNPSGSETKIIDTTNNWWNPSYVTVDQNHWPTASDYVAGRGFYFQNLKTKYTDPPCGINEGKPYLWYPGHNNFYQEVTYMELSTHTLEFRMHGNYMGKLRAVVTCYVNPSECSLPPKGHPTSVLICTDECYLASGVGEVIITSANAVETLGTETTPETHITYDKYLYEEGGTVEMEVNAMYSGASIPPGQEGSGLGWVLKVFNSAGTMKQQWNIPDNVNGYPVSYTIPSGAWIPNDPNDNEWTVVLYNTLFAQHETRIFVIDEIESAPGETTITTNKDRYTQFETVTVTLRANANPTTKIPITKFKAWACYDTWGGSDYAYLETDLTAHLVSGTLYEASFSFQLAKGNKFVYIQARAFDTQGRPGVGGQKIIYSEQQVGNYQVTINVKANGNPISNAVVEFGTNTGYTPSDGQIKFYVAYGTYDLKVNKDGYPPYSQSSILVNHDMTINVNLEGDIGGLSLNLIIAAVVLIVCILAAFLLPVPLVGRILIIILGIILAIIIYLYL